LDSLAVPRAGFVHVSRDGGAPHERHRVDVGMGQQRVDRLPIALHDVADAVGETGALHQFREQE
jgi:hypothetical protein